jgi:hypothetical protein
MQIIKLYKYKRENGGTTISPVKPDCEHTEMVRLVADEGKVLTDGENMTTCVDTDTADGWTEIDAPEEPDEPVEPSEEDIYEGLVKVYTEGVNSLDK